MVMMSDTECCKGYSAILQSQEWERSKRAMVFQPLLLVVRQAKTGLVLKSSKYELELY